MEVEPCEMRREEEEGKKNSFHGISSERSVKFEKRAQKICFGTKRGFLRESNLEGHKDEVWQRRQNGIGRESEEGRRGTFDLVSVLLGWTCCVGAV